MKSQGAITTYLKERYPRLRSYMGDTAFSSVLKTAAAKAQNPREAAQDFPAEMEHQQPGRGKQALVELAMLEQAMRQAEDNAVQARPPNKGTPPRLHPSVQLLHFKSNAFSIWSALAAEEFPPAPTFLHSPQSILVWYHPTGPRFRLLGSEEATALSNLQEMLGGKTDNQATSFWDQWLDTAVVMA